MKKNNFIFYVSYYNAIEKLDRNEMLATLHAIVKYGVTGITPKNMSKTTKSILDLIKPNIDSSQKKYLARITNGKKGGRPKITQQKPNNNLTKTQLKPNQNLNKDKDKDIDIDNIKENTKKKSFESVLNNIQNIELRNCLHEFITMRDSLKKPLTPYALELIIKKLYNLSKNLDEQIEIVKQSITKCWQDLYPLNSKPNKKEDTFEILKELYIEETQKTNDNEIVIDKESL